MCVFRVLRGRRMWRGQDLRDAIWHAQVHMFAKLQAARRAPGQGTGVRYGRRVVQVALSAEKEIVPYPGPIADGRLPRIVPE